MTGILTSRFKKLLVHKCWRLVSFSTARNHNIKNYKDSAYIRQGMSYQCAISVSPSGESDPDRHQNLIICSSAHCNLPWKFHANPFRSFCAKLLTEKRTNNDENNLLGGNNEKIIAKTVELRRSGLSLNC